MLSRIAANIAGMTAALLAVSAQAQTYTGVSGSGWREMAIPIAQSPRVTAQAAGTYQPRAAVLIQIDSTAGLANAPLPQVVKDNILRDGFGTEPIYIDRDIAKALGDGTASTKFAGYIQPDSRSSYNSVEGTEGTGRAQALKVTAQGLFCDSGWRDYTLNKDVDFNSIAASKDMSGLNLAFDGKMGGGANIKITVEYKKSDWSLCLPYAVRFKQSTLKGHADLNDARLALTASVSTTVAETSSRTDLYKKDGLVWIGPVPVWYTYAVPFEYGFKVILGAAATADYSSQMKGTVTFDYVCKGGKCTGSNDTSTVAFTNSTPNWGIQADATFDPFVKLGVEGRLYPIGSWYLASAGLALKFSTPLMVYGYYGQACGDANKDGKNETVQTYFADLQARVSLLASWSVLGKEKVEYLSFGGWAGRRINGGLHRVLNTENLHTPLWNRSLYYTDSGSPSIFSPMLRQQPGVWTGSSYEHLLKVSMRPCVPFETHYLVDIKEPSGKLTRVSVPNKAAVGEAKFYSTTPTLSLSAVGTRDDDGRVFNNSASSAPVLGLDGTGGGTSPGTGTFAFVKMSQTARGSSGDVMTVTLKNIGTGPITAITHTCSGMSWHGWGTTPTMMAAGASADFQCRAAASGSYTPPVVTVNGSASNTPFKPTL